MIDTSKKSIAKEEQLKEVLKGQLYRKEMIEHASVRLSKGASAYDNYYNEIQKALKDGFVSDSLNKAFYEKELIEVKMKGHQFVVDFKSNKREYEHYLIPQIEKTVKALKIKQTDIEFTDIAKEAKQMMEAEIYGETRSLPDNVEHTSVMALYSKHISLLEKYVDRLFVKWRESEDNELEKARLELEVFTMNLKRENLKSRLAKRENYYNNIFLPQYEKDLKEADKYLDAYLKRGKALSRLNLDHKLKFMLDEYAQHKNDSEKKWLFYTTLRNRVDEIMELMRENAEKDTRIKKHYNLMTPIREAESK